MRLDIAPTLVTAIFVTGLLVGACGARESTPTEATMHPAGQSNADGILLEVRIEAGDGPAIGYRIFGDRRYEMLQGDDPDWVLVRELETDDFEAFRSIMAEQDLAGLRASYPGDGAMDGATTSWRIAIGGEVREVTVGHEGVVDELEALWDALPPVRTAAAVTTEWRVLRDGAEQTHALPCGTDAVPAIDALTRAMAAGAMATGEPAADAERVLTVVWKQDGVEVNRQEVWSDGWQIAFQGEAELLRKRYTDAEISAIRDRIAAVAWDRLNERCP